MSQIKKKNAIQNSIMNNLNLLIIFIVISGDATLGDSVLLVGRVISVALVYLIICLNWRIKVNNQKKGHFVLAVGSANIRVRGSRFYMLQSENNFLLLIDTVEFKLITFNL